MIQREMIGKIAVRVHEMGGRALLVGGCVRDEILSIPCYDIDCEVHGVQPDTLKAILGEFGEIDETGSVYGIFTIKGAGLDFALPRREKRTGPGHKDFVVEVDQFLSLEEAAKRRDFTVNAIMRDVLTGEYVDPFGGMEDLKNGILRAVPGGQFEEDPLRVLRGAQFAARFHLKPDGQTIAMMRRMPLDQLSASRVWAETKKALTMADEPDVFFRVLEEADALACWFPEIEALRRTPENTVYHPEGNTFEHTMMTLNAAAEIRNQMQEPLSFMLAALTHDLGKAVSARLNDKGVWQADGHESESVPLCEKLLTRLGVGKRLIAYAKNMCALHTSVHACYYEKACLSSMNMMFDESVNPRELTWLAICDSRGTGKPRSHADEEEAFLFERLAQYEQAISCGMPDAKLLMTLGVKPGPDMKKAIAFAREQVLCGRNAQQATEIAAEKYQ